MRYRVKTASDRLRAPQAPAAPPSHPRVPAARPPVLTALPVRPFRALAWPPTRHDVTWTCDPRFARAPAGWCRIGVYS